MSQTDNNDILLSLHSSPDVSLLRTKTGEFKPFLNVSPLYPLGIHVNYHKEIILGVMERGATYTLTNKSCRQVIIFGIDGKQKQSYEYDKHKQRLFTTPARITSNVKNDIVVIDSTAYDEGRVVILDKVGQTKWIYQGQSQVNPGNKPFNPLDIVTTSIGHVIVTDVNNHSLYVLSEVGDVLACKGMKNLGIIYPTTMDIDTKGQLWVGCYSGNKQRTDAKLHEMKISF
ncbi:protein wech-like [Mytilus edulis]|uniref:protein wech-like n=1 Tax=Mytilus edulis TaxID=6550 RepID=UPI0039EEAC44